MKKRIWFSSGLIILMLSIFVCLPLSAVAEKDEPIKMKKPFEHDLLPKTSEIKPEKGTPIYDKYDFNSYTLDTNTSGSLFMFIDSIIQMTDGIMVFNGIWNRTVIWFSQHVFGGMLIDSVRDQVGNWAEEMFSLFLGQFLITGLFALGIVCIFSYIRSGSIGDQLLRAFGLLMVWILLGTNMATILKWTGDSERMAADVVFLAYAKIIDKKKIPESEKKKESVLEASRNKALVGMGEKYWKTFHYYPWQLAEFGRIAKPKYDKNGKAYYTGLDKQIHKDTKKVLKLNPTSPTQWAERQQYLKDWTKGENFFLKYYNKFAPKDWKMGERSVYPSMTPASAWMRFLIALITLFGSISYGSLIMTLALFGIAAEIIVYLLVLLLTILMFSSFVPAWGEKILSSWGQGFVVGSFFKVFLAALVMGALGVTSLLGYGTSLLGQYGLIVTFVVHIAIFIAVVVLNKWVIGKLLLPIGLYDKLHQKAQDTTEKVKDLGVGGALTAAGFGLAAVTGNPAFLRAGARRILGGFQNKGKGKGGDGGFDPVGIIKKDDSFKPEAKKGHFVPEGFNQNSKAVISSNPYEKGSSEAQLFDDMKEKGLNPYSLKDQDRFEKDYINKSGSGTQPIYRNPETMNNLRNHSEAFAKRKSQNQYNERRNRLAQELERIEDQAIKRAAEKRRSKSVFRKIGNGFKERMWGK